MSCGIFNKWRRLRQNKKWLENDFRRLRLFLMKEKKYYISFIYRYADMPINNFYDNF